MKPSPNWWRHSPWLRRGSAGLAGALGGVEDLVDDAIGATPDAMGACSGWSTPVSAFKYFPSACRGRCSLRSWGSFGFIPVLQPIVAGVKCILFRRTAGRARTRCLSAAPTTGVGEALCSSWGDADLEAEVLDPALEPLRLNRWIVSELEESSTRVVIEGTVGEEVPGDVQDGVGDGDGGLVGPSPSGESGVLGGEVGAFGPRRAPGCFDECTLQPGRTFSRAGGVPLPG